MCGAEGAVLETVGAEGTREEQPLPLRLNKDKRRIPNNQTSVWTAKITEERLRSSNRKNDNLQDNSEGEQDCNLSCSQSLEKRDLSLRSQGSRAMLL